MKKTLLLTGLMSVFGICVIAQAQPELEYAKISGSTGSDFVSKVAVDDLGNVYSVGLNNSATNDYDPDTAATAISTIQFSSSNDYSVYIQKLDDQGNLLWVKTLDSPNSTFQRVNDLEIASNGDLIICGSFKGTIDFDMGVGTTNAVSNNSGQNRDGYIVRLTENGDLVWVKTFGGNNSASDLTDIISLDTDNQGNVYAAGFFEGSSDMDPGSGFDMLYADYAREGFVLKLTNAGALDWAYDIGAPSSVSGSEQQTARNVAIDGSGNVWVTADIEGEIEYAGFPGTTYTVTSGSKAIGILKLNGTNGVPLLQPELIEASGSAGIIGYDMTFDAHDNLYLVGWASAYINLINNSVTYTPPSTNQAERFFTLSFDNDLIHRWGIIAPQDASTSIGQSRNYSVAYNSTGQITVAGFAVGDKFDADPSASDWDTIFNPYTNTNGFSRISHIITYDTLGSYAWSGRISSLLSYSQCQDLFIDGNDNLYVGGYISSNSNALDPFSNQPTDYLTNGGRDIFVLKLTESCIVNIPDANFKAYLVGETSINTNADTEIQCSEAAAYTGSIACLNSNISDLTGIEAFTAITALYCHTNSLTSLDLSNNVALTTVGCAYNNISSLDLSNNSALVDLDVIDNNMISLNVANGNNHNMPNISFKAQTNPNLTCIEVDDAAYSTSTWQVIDAQTSFSEDCALFSSISKVEKDIVSLYPNPTTGVVSLSKSVNKLNVYTLTGSLIKAYTNINTIDLSVLSKGVYLIEIITPKGTQTERLIIE